MFLSIRLTLSTALLYYSRQTTFTLCSLRFRVASIPAVSDFQEVTVQTNPQ